MVAGGSPARTKIRWLSAAALLGSGMLAGAGRAHADGALPQSLGILVPSDRPQEITLATNFGMNISEDGGATWLWTCEDPDVTSMGYLYSVGPPPRDRLYGLSPETGLAFSDDGSCSWHRAGGALDAAIASDYFVDRANPDRVLAIAAGKDADGGISPQSVYASPDGGTTFAATPIFTAPATENVVGIEIAESDPKVIYLAMYSYPGVRHPALVRSGDSGQTWTTIDVEAGLGANEFRILAVDPEDPNLLYLRVITAGAESVAVTRDGGATFSTPVSFPNGSLSAFARLDSGTVLVGALIYVGTSGATNGAAYRSTDRGITFSHWMLSPQPHIVGLAGRGGVLYLAGKDYSDGWALATSTDEGATIHPLTTYDQVRGVKACVQVTCGSTCDFEAASLVWSDDVCTGALLDGGVSPPGPVPSAAGCRCAIGGPASRTEALGLGLVMFLGVTATFRRRSARHVG